MSGRRPPKATISTVVLLVVFYVLLRFAVPRDLPPIVRALFALTNASLAMVLLVFAFNELATRQNRFRSFGRDFETGTALGLFAFAAVLAWWFTPWAPL